MKALTIAVLFVLSVFAAQLVRLQGLDSAGVAAEARDLRVVDATIPALRGRILANDGTVLASSVIRETVAVDQTAVCTYTTRKEKCDPATAPAHIAAAADRLAPLLGVSASSLVPQLTGTARYKILSKNVSPLTWNRISEAGIPGIYRDLVATSSSRVYPQGATSAALVGYVTGGGAGGGVEYMANQVLTGTNGSQRSEIGASGTVIPGGDNVLSPAVNGRDVTLTINPGLQWYAQNALAQKVKETRAQSGTVVILDARNGDLLSVASYPSFDPVKDIGKAGVQTANLAFTDVFEPGSTAKIMTMAAAMEEGKVTASTPIVIPNRLHRFDTAFRDSHDHGVEYLTVAGTLAQSSNLGTMLVGETMTPKTLESYFRKFGLGSTSGVGYPAESAGLLPPSEKWSGTQRSTVMFGQGVSVTAIQAASVFQTIANDGVRIPPRLVKSTTDADGHVVDAPQHEGVRVVSTTVAKDVSRMLEGVVSTEGTAPQAQVPGYRVAGKTGTADRYVEAVGGYSGKTASFIGYAPADDPKVVVAVILQRPIKGYYGGLVAGPVFHDVMTYALQDLKIPPTGTTGAPVALKVDPADAAKDPTTLRDGR